MVKTSPTKEDLMIQIVEKNVEELLIVAHGCSAIHFLAGPLKRDLSMNIKTVHDEIVEGDLEDLKFEPLGENIACILILLEVGDFVDMEDYDSAIQVRVKHIRALYDTAPIIIITSDDERRDLPRLEHRVFHINTIFRTNCSEAYYDKLVEFIKEIIAFSKATNMAS